MGVNRREFITLTCACAAGCAASGGRGDGSAAVTLRPVAIDAGPAADYASDGVYDRFRAKGFFVIRDGPRLFALSAFCTHRVCKLRAEADRSFYCKCHGSTFDPRGKVTEGPATRDLPTLPTSIDDGGHLVVHAIAG